MRKREERPAIQADAILIDGPGRDLGVNLLPGKPPPEIRVWILIDGVTRECLYRLRREPHVDGAAYLYAGHFVEGVGYSPKKTEEET